MGGGAMEINTVPQLVATADDGTTYSKIPRLRFPVDEEGKAVIVQDVTYYSKEALYDDFLKWRKGGPAVSGRFDEAGAYVARLSTRFPGFQQDGVPMEGIAETFDTKVFEDNTWGLVWKDGGDAEAGVFPQYYAHREERRVAVSPQEVPAETGLLEADFALVEPRGPFVSRDTPAWTQPGPVAGPFQVQLIDGSTVTYAWYRFVDQPSFQQYDWSDEKKAALQAFVEKIHRAWPTDRDYMPPPTSGELVSLDPALFVTPPPGLEVGFVPIVTKQERDD
jgi:hypothetical protein